MMSQATRALVWLATAGIALGCADAPPTDPGDTQPVGPPAFTLAPSSVAADSQPIVYVSLPSGSIPNGLLARLRVEATGLTTVAPVIDGGFDPVALDALVGDTIAITVETSAGAGAVFIRLEVKPKTPLIIIRTIPPKRKRDVPLNARIAVVFSEPIDPASLTNAAVQLRMGSVPVDGALEFIDSTRTAVAFIPAVQLAASTAYILIVSRDIRDGTGSSLEEPASVPFTTGTTSTQIASVILSPSFMTIARGGTNIFAASVTDARGNVLYGREITWSSSDSTVVSFRRGVQGGVVWAIGVGPVTITATTGGVTGLAQLMVTGAPAVAVVRVQPDSARLTQGLVLWASATLLDAQGRTMYGPSVTWSSSDTSVATISQSGMITGVAGGPVTITATSEGKSGTARITVVPARLASLTSGGSHSCGLSGDGLAYCWGAGFFSQLGDHQLYSQSPIPNPVLGWVFTSLAAGADHTCGLTPAGIAYCWGRGESGQTGQGFTASAFEGPDAGGEVLGGVTFTSLAAGGSHSCGLTSGGAAWCWGRNSDGELGDGTSVDRYAPVVVAGGRSFTALAAGASHTCGLTSTGAAFCWGRNASGQLGDGTLTGRLTPTAVIGALTFTTLSAGEAHTCGRTAAGTVHCWGWNGSGQVGDGSRTNRQAPVLVATSQLFATLTAGFRHSCAATAAGAAYCWGDNTSGQLGDGTLDESLAPMAVSGPHRFAALASGRAHSCGRTSAGAALCWGVNTAGQLGDGTFSPLRATPAAVTGFAP